MIPCFDAVSPTRDLDAEAIDAQCYGHRLYQTKLNHAIGHVLIFIPHGLSTDYVLHDRRMVRNPDFWGIRLEYKE